MTTQELNRDIKRLYASIKKLQGQPDKYYSYIENEAKKEFMRLYRADDKFEYMSKESMKIMLRLNIRHRFNALHNFGIFIEY